jgi:hypothetical protein
MMRQPDHQRRLPRWLGVPRRVNGTGWAIALDHHIVSVTRSQQPTSTRGNGPESCRLGTGPKSIGNTAGRRERWSITAKRRESAMILGHSTSTSTWSRTMTANANDDCAVLRQSAAADPNQRMSVHRTSQGHLVYYRCYCGRPGATLIGLPARP